MVTDISIIALISNTPNGRAIFAVRFFQRVWQFVSEVMMLPIGIGTLTLWKVILYLWILYMIGILILHLVGPGGA